MLTQLKDVLKSDKNLQNNKIMTQENPFQSRHMIKNPESFFGRKEESRNILERLQKAESCSIVGERRIGKSSLIWHISQTAKGSLGSSYSFFYHDLQNAKYHTALGFFQTLIKDLEITTDSISEKNTPNKNLVAFTDEIGKLTGAGRKIVFCFDEFESLFRHPTEFTNDFFDHFRSEINAGNFALLTASKDSLQHCMSGRKIDLAVLQCLYRNGTERIQP